MKKIFQKLSFSALKRNPAFSAGLLILFALMAAVSTVAATLGETVPASVDGFMESADMPDGWITTELSEEETGREIEKISGVKSVSKSLTLPVRAVLPSGADLSLAFSGVEEEEFQRFYIKEEVPDREDLTGVWVSAYFAEKNGVKPGDILTLKLKQAEKEVHVNGLVSLPETMVCVRSETSWGDATGYGYIFMKKEDADSLLFTRGKANYWSIRLKDGLSGKERKAALDAAGEVFGDKTLSVVLYDTSSAKSNIDDLMTTIRSICNTFPLLIFFVGLFFMILFVSQVVRNRSRDIGLMVALGHSRKEVVLIFFRYTVLLLIPGVIAGIVTGLAVTYAVSGRFVNKYALPGRIFRMDAGRFAVMLLIETGLSLISCILSTYLAINTDPARSMGGGGEIISRPPAVFRKLKIDPILKAGLTSLFRNRRRTVLSILAIAACIGLSAGSLEFLVGYADAIDRTFGKRYTYDALVAMDNGRDGLAEIEGVEGVSTAEPVLSFMTELRNGEKSMKVKVSALPADSRLIVPYTKDYERVPLSDGVIMDEWTASELGFAAGDTVIMEGVEVRITGIARNLIDRAEYISFETAEKMGYKEPDTVAIKIDPDTDREKVLKEITGLSGYEFTNRCDQQRVYQEDCTQMVQITISILQAIAILMGMIIVLNMAALSIRERRREFSVLFALGVPDGKFAGMIAVENLAVFVTAVLLGFPIAWFGAKAMNSIMSMPSQVIEMFDFGRAFAIGVGLALAYLSAGIVSGIVKLRFLDPAVALSEE